MLLPICQVVSHAKRLITYAPVYGHLTWKSFMIVTFAEVLITPCARSARRQCNYDRCWAIQSAGGMLLVLMSSITVLPPSLSVYTNPTIHNNILLNFQQYSLHYYLIASHHATQLHPVLQLQHFGLQQ